MAPLSPLTVPNSPTHSSRCAPESDTATVSYSLNAAITRSSMALHPDLLDKHLLLLSRPAILNPLLAFPMYVRYTLLHLRGERRALPRRSASGKVDACSDRLSETLDTRVNPLSLTYFLSLTTRRQSSTNI